MRFDYYSNVAPASFPSKLLALLLARYNAGARPLLFLPCELRTSNGRALGGIVRNLAEEMHTPSVFKKWLQDHVVFEDTLVDRIVSEQVEPIGAIAEPYALWGNSPIGTSANSLSTLRLSWPTTSSLWSV